MNKLTRLRSLALSLACIVSTIAIAGQPTQWASAATPVPTATATAKSTNATATPTTAKATPAPTTRPAATAKATAKATADAGITIQSITRTTSIKSYKTLVGMKLDGASEGRVAKGDFNVEAQTILAAKKQSFALSGSAMSQLLGKYLRGLPVNKVTLFLLDKNTYIFAQSLLSVCAVPKTAIGGLDQLGSGLSADALLSSLSGSNKIYGTLVGDETVNGIATKHYKLDAAKMNALAKQNRIDASLRNGDVWLAKDGNYVVRLNANADGALAKATGVDFKGNVTLGINVSDMNKVPDIVLPGQCSRPIQI